MITFKCEHCGEPMTVPACLVGETEKCPSCLELSTIPSKKIPTEADMEDLIGRLHHPNAEIRCKAAAEIGQCKSLKSVKLLVAAFNDRDKFVREQVMESLRQIGDPQAAGMIVRDLGGHWVSEAIVHEAVRELVKFGPPAGPSLTEILVETNKNPRKYEPEAIRAAIMLLGLLGEQQAMPLIAKMFRRHFDIHVRDEAAYSLIMIGRPEQWPDIAAMTESRRRSTARELAQKVIKENRILI